MKSDMPHEVFIRPACTGDRDFIEGLVSSLLEFGSPAWRDVEGLIPGFRAVLAQAVSAQDPECYGVDRTRSGWDASRLPWDVGGTLGKGSESTLRRRRDEWLAAGVFVTLLAEAIAAYDRSWAVTSRRNRGYAVRSIDATGPSPGQVRGSERNRCSTPSSRSLFAS
jgi:hypothetical protein